MKKKTLLLNKNIISPLILALRMIRSPKCTPTSHTTQCKSVCRRVCIPSESRTRCRTDPHKSEKKHKISFQTICELINEMKNTRLSTWWQCCRGVCARSPHSLTYSVTQFGLRRWNTGAGVILTNAADNDVKLGAKMDEKKNLRNGCTGEPSTLRAIIACWWWSEAPSRAGE